MPRPLIANRAEMFVDTEYDQNELGRDAREDDADDDARNRGQQLDEAAERADRHCREAGENACDAEQSDERDNQPVKRLDDRRRNETIPLKQILKIEHRRFSRQVEYDSRELSENG